MSKNTEINLFRFPRIKSSGLIFIPLKLLKATICVLVITISLSLVVLIMFLISPLFLFKPRLAYRLIQLVGGLEVYSWAYLIEWFSGVSIQFSGDDLEEYESAICLCNHVTNADFLLLFNIAARAGMLGNTKFLSKKSIKYIPLIGQSMYFLGMVFLERAWKDDKAALEKSFKHLTDHKIPLWLIAFVEGTRITDFKLKQSIAFQKKNNLPITTQVMAPKVRGFHAMLKHFKGTHVKYVYDFTISYPDGVFNLIHVLFGFLQARLSVHINKIPIESFPDDYEELKEHMFKMYQKKDALLKSMKKDKKGKLNYPNCKNKVVPLEFKDWTFQPWKVIDKETKKRFKKVEKKD